MPKRDDFMLAYLLFINSLLLSHASNETLVAPTLTQLVPELSNPIVQDRIAQSPLLQSKLAKVQMEMTTAWGKVIQKLAAVGTRIGMVKK